jgi:hypothetical protein
MEAGTIERIRKITSAIDHHIGVLRGHGLDHAALMLDMARIDLESRVNAISEDEFTEFCRALERRDAGTTPAARRRKCAAPRSARDGLLDRRHQLFQRKRLG